MSLTQHPRLIKLNYTTAYTSMSAQQATTTQLTSAAQPTPINILTGTGILVWDVLLHAIPHIICDIYRCNKRIFTIWVANRESMATYVMKRHTDQYINDITLKANESVFCYPLQWGDVSLHYTFYSTFTHINYSLCGRDKATCDHPVCKILCVQLSRSGAIGLCTFDKIDTINGIKYSFTVSTHDHTIAMARICNCALMSTGIGLLSITLSVEDGTAYRTVYVGQFETAPASARLPDVIDGMYMRCIQLVYCTSRHKDITSYINHNIKALFSYMRGSSIDSSLHMSNLVDILRHK